jgi:hypothetical protein
MFQSNGQLNNDLIANFNENPWKDYIFTITSTVPFGLDVMFETQLIGDFDNTGLEYALPYNRLGLSKEIVAKYSSDIVMHLNVYTQYKKDQTGNIIGIKNKTDNQLFFETSQYNYFTIDNGTTKKDYPSYNFNKCSLTSDYVDVLFKNTFSLFTILKFNDLNNTLRSVFSTTTGTFRLTISLTNIRVSGLNVSRTYTIALNFTDFIMIFITSTSIRIGTQIFNHGLNINIKGKKLFIIKKKFKKL